MLTTHVRRLTAAILTGLAVACTAVAVQAQSPVPLQSMAQAGDPPARVGRLADIVGTVWSYDPDANDWVRAERNRPVTTGDRLATDAGGRAEIRLGSSTVRLDGGAELLVSRLDDTQVALELTAGSATVRLRDSESARQFAITTADGRFTTPTIGSFRFDLTPRSSQVTVLSGRATYEGPNSALTVVAGQRAEFWLDERQVAQYVISTPTRDAFAAWSDDRDRREDASISARYVSPEMTGVEDLDSHGTWQQSADDGALWLPTAVAVDWAPYSSGHWTWVSPWGWTWVDDAPWGFAPFHYGRWLRWHDRWAWAPGSYVERPCYAPALVGWIGGAVIVGQSDGRQNGRYGGYGGDRGRPPQVGWFPLAPHEVYVPHYRVSPGYVRNVNVTHVVDIPNLAGIVRDPDAAVRRYDYRNRRFAPSVTMVPASVLRDRSPVAPAAAAWRHAQPVTGATARADAALPTMAAPPLQGGGRPGRDGIPFGRRDGVPPPSPVAVVTGPGRQRPIDAGRGGEGLPANVALPPRVQPTSPPAVAVAVERGLERRPADPAGPNVGGDRVALPPGVAGGGRRQAQPFVDNRRESHDGEAVRPQIASPQPSFDRRAGDVRAPFEAPAPVAQRPAPATVTAPQPVVTAPQAQPEAQGRRFAPPEVRQRVDVERPQPGPAMNGDAFGNRPSRGESGDGQRFRTPAVPREVQEARPQGNGLPAAAQPPARPAVVVAPPQMPPPVRPAMPVAPVIPPQIGAPAQPAPSQRGTPADERGRQDGQRLR